MLLNRDSVIFIVFLIRVLLEDSAPFPSQRKRIPCIHLDDVIIHLDSQLSKHHSSGWQELSVQTFLCVENLWTILACIHPEFSATCLDAFQCSTSWKIYFQNRNIGRQSLFIYSNTHILDATIISSTLTYNPTRMPPKQVTYLKGSSLESFTLGPTPKIYFSSAQQQHLAMVWE